MSSDDSAALDKINNDQIAATGDQGNTGIWMGVWDSDKGMYLAAYGAAEADGAEATIEDHNRIGSITKTFPATAILQLVAAGDLEVGATVLLHTCETEARTATCAGQCTAPG